ncbi:MAG: AAA family ATPase [Deltaproteobacteria bacterium]|nr:AAA family ATPase [Deltaproteobacteria bacterium]
MEEISVKQIDIVVRNRYDKYTQGVAQYTRAKKQHKQARTNRIVAKKGQVILQQASEQIQRQAHEQIAKTITQCLQFVFGDSYSFCIKFERKRNRTQACLQLLKDGNIIADPANEDSGGVLSVASFALRLSCLFLHKPTLQKVLILDEPFSHVSKKYLSRVRELLERLSQEFGCQIIMVTHISELQIGKVVEL